MKHRVLAAAVAALTMVSVVLQVPESLPPQERSRRGQRPASRPERDLPWKAADARSPIG